MKKLILILAALTCACSWAGVTSARLGALGRNDTVVTNVTDVTPGNYATVSNRAMTASTYTDSALGAFASTGAVKRAELHGTPTRWTDATGCVWEVGQVPGQWTRTQGPSDIYVVWHDGDDAPPYTTEGSGWYFQGDNQWPQIVSKDASSTILSDTLQNEGYYGQGIVASFARGFVDDTNIVGRVALTNDIPRTAGDVGAYPAASGSALESGKQDRLPYPTNAIPFSAIDGAPSGGGQEWQEVWDDAMAGAFHYVTNGMLRFDIDAASIIVETNGWPNGAAMFSRIRVMESSYTWPACVRLVGYGTWPTNDFQSVWWRSGTNIYVNVILEE